MNLGNGLLFELENGKPKVTFISHGGKKNPAKVSFRPRAAHILGSRQPSCEDGGSHREGRSKAAGGGGRGAAASFTINTINTEGRSSAATIKTQELHKSSSSSKAVAKLKTDKHKQSSSTLRPLRANGKLAPLQGGGKAGLKDAPANGAPELKDGVVRLTNEQLQQILNGVQTPNTHQTPNIHLTPNTHQPEEEAGLQGGGESEGSGRRTQTTCLSLLGGQSGSQYGGGGGGGGEEEKEKHQAAEVTSTNGSQEKDKSSTGCVFSWMGERVSDSRAAIDAKKAQWRKDLDEQVAQKQQRSASNRLQAEEDAASLGSVQSSLGHREPPAAVRSCLKLGEVTPMEEVLSVERREEQRRRWLEELDRQRVEATERRRQEKLQQNQTEDLELWAIHFDSMQQQRPPVLPEQGEWEPSSSLSLVWEAESVGGTSVDTAGGHTSRTSYLRTMTSLLDPAQLEERERRRLKQLEQQRAIEAQIEERRQQREREEARRRREEEAEDHRVVLERELLQKQFELEAQKNKQKDQPEKNHKDQRLQETREPDGNKRTDALEESSGSSSHRDAAVQTEATHTVSTPDVHHEPPPPAPSPAPPSCPPPDSRSRAARAGKENICVAAGGDMYQPFARTERSMRDKRRPEWNTQRPSRRFVPASERYPVTLQRNRQESRLKRQAELLALQERTCPSRTGPPPPPPPPQHQELRLCSNPPESRPSPPRKDETDFRRQNQSAAAQCERGRSPPASAVRHKVLSQQASSCAPPPVLEFLPYVRTDEVFNLDPLEPADTPPPLTHSGSAPARSHPDPLLHPELLRNAPYTPRQQEILRGLAQLRQGLLQKQRELETDLNPLLRHHDNEHWLPPTTHYM